GLLRKLQPRLYSISSSPKAHPGEVHLTVSAVRYQAHGRDRRGVASCFLADRCAAPDTRVPVFVHANPAFRPPAPDAPLIMIGPGTGIAPFRAFLEERRAIGATGRNWLLFGDQHEATDFLYREELESWRRDGTLHRLDLAWSRDQEAKVYVQDRLREAAAEVWDWLENGATVCVCGDAARMAKDVDAALHQILQQVGHLTPDAATRYLQSLQAQKRYARDVY
ncbi:MAG: sulfite reductase subunit alpha, partial [Verrucomicrobiales bacterium]|nr:sulfite reductase subunit alpha [Verrucomicrobiales bacterium]